MEFKIRLKVNRGLIDLETLSIRRGTFVDTINTGYIQINGIPLSSHPVEITGSDVNGFVWDIDFLEGPSPKYAANTYYFIATDVNGLADTISLNISPDLVPPFVGFDDSPLYTKDNDEVDSGSFVKVKLLANRKCDFMKAVSIFENSQIIDFNDIVIDGTGERNPFSSF